jgi:hypothetical protein
MSRIFLSVILIIFPRLIFGQNIGIGTNTPNANALLDLTSENKGLLIPRVPLVAPNNPAPFSTPPNSLLVYNSAFNFDIAPGFFYWNGLRWLRLPNNEEVWTTKGNAGTNPATNFIGTTDNIPLYFRIRNVNSGLIDSNINRTTFGFGTGRPQGGIHNAAFGFKALGTHGANAIQNTAMGSRSMEFFRIGFGNSALGFGALLSLDSGIENTAIGRSALVSLANGRGNTAIGGNALSDIIQGDSNTAIGFMANVKNQITISRSTAIGALATVGRSDAIVLGSVAGENLATRGVFVGIGTINPQRKLHIVDEAAAGINSNANSSLVLEKNGSANYINFLNTTAESGILFGVAGAPGGAANGGILYNNPSFAQGMQFRTGGNANRMVIDNLGNVGIGNNVPAQKLDVEGNIRVSGEVYRGSGTANLLPICYGSIAQAGTISTGTGNFSVTKAGTGIYDISITGESFSFSNYITSITPVSTAARSNTATSSGGALRVRIFDASGTAVDTPFHFIVFKP